MCLLHIYLNHLDISMGLHTPHIKPKSSFALLQLATILRTPPNLAPILKTILAASLSTYDLAKQLAEQ